MGASSPPAMVERRHCSPRSGHHAAVERARTAGIGSRGRGEANTPKSARNGGVEGENNAERKVTGVPTHSGDLSRARGDSPSAVEREHATRNDEAELLAVAERKDEAGAG